MCRLAFGKIVKQRRAITGSLAVVLVKLLARLPVRSFIFFMASLYFLCLADSNIFCRAISQAASSSDWVALCSAVGSSAINFTGITRVHTVNKKRIRLMLKSFSRKRPATILF